MGIESSLQTSRVLPTVNSYLLNSNAYVLKPQLALTFTVGSV